MNLRVLSVFLWTLGVMAVVEVTMEYRGYVRGFEAPLFGRRGKHGRADDGTTLNSPDGRSTQKDTWSDVHIPTVWVASASHAVDDRLGVDLCFPALLENRLRSGSLPWRVYSGSRPGWLIADNLALLNDKVRSIRPQVVVLYQMSMDVKDLCLRAVSGNYDDDSQGELLQVPDLFADLTARLQQEALKATSYQLMKTNVTPLLAGQRVLMDGLPDDAIDAFSRRLRRFLDAVRDAGAVPVLCTFATSDGSKQVSEIPFEIRQNMLSFNMHLSPAGWLTTVSRLNHLVRRTAQEEDIALLDCDAALTGHRDYFKDFVHFSKRGHERMAELLAERLRGLECSTHAAVKGEVRNEL